MHLLKDTTKVFCRDHSFSQARKQPDDADDLVEVEVEGKVLKRRSRTTKGHGCGKQVPADIHMFYADLQEHAQQCTESLALFIYNHGAMLGLPAAEDASKRIPPNKFFSFIMLVVLFVEFLQTSEPSSVHMLLTPTCKNMRNNAEKSCTLYFKTTRRYSVACGRRRLKRMSPLLQRVFSE